ncbi:hypothetical protein PENTCL1PPCAC_29799 [Pristionchus entomophagus]|uniref:Uncharacterized protein n=1 Tax=Pristionchus entomophagus TaxID=358040 RepID=A0AAV5UKL3_9BILA|nr:hypothetical protein PENTCL1PPCAC_29799 [Pristionchus entomophagus]
MEVASGRSAPWLSSVASIDGGEWRRHAAILLANLAHSPFAMQCVRRFGEELASCGRDAAADFCFLSVSLLTGQDIFSQFDHHLNFSIVASIRKRIALLHASLPDEIAESSELE